MENDVTVDPSGSAQAGDSSVEQLRKLQSISDAALTHVGVDDLLDELLVRIRSAVEADTCALLLYDEKAGELVARAAKGLEEEVERGVRIPIGRGFAGRIASERRPVVLDDVDQAEVVNPILRERGIKSLLGVPLIVGGRVLGVLHVGSLTRRLFTPDDVELLEHVAQRVALAMERAFVYEEVVRLEQLERDFIALASHELRAPASSVYGLVETLYRRREELPPELVEELQTTLLEQSRRLKHLVEQLLDLSRLDAHAIEVRPRPVRLWEQIDAIVAASVPEPRDVRLDVDPHLEVAVDPHALDRILSNLLANAVLYGEPPVLVVAARSDRHVRIAVEDRGRGVTPEFVPHLFDRFRRSEASAQVQTGSGLGLAIALAYARAHGGDLGYAPVEPTGARFEVVLPLRA